VLGRSRLQIRFNPESIQWVVLLEDTLYILARSRRQPQRPVPQLQRRALGAELQLARQRLERQRSSGVQLVSS